jgi:SAM-dependent methyltransferase
MAAPAAYEAIAAAYDEHIRGDEWMRRALQRHYLSVFRGGQRVLDVGCGTGTDALELARHGIAVLGVDGSPGMIAQLRAKSKAAGLQHLVEGRVLPVSELASVGEQFDGAYSSFAALSTVDLARFGFDLARLVPRGARAVLHLLNRFSVWEWLGLLARRRWRAAAALRSQHERAFRIGGRDVAHHLYFAREAYHAHLASGFLLRQTYALGALRPPHTVTRLPLGLVSGLEALDVRLGGLAGVRDAGRFFVLDLERRAA